MSLLVSLPKGNKKSDCTPSCVGIIGGTLGSLSGTAADLYNYNPSDAATEADALNVLAGTNFATGIQTDAGGVNTLTFSTVAQWIGLKLGAGTFFLNNTSGPVKLFITYLKSAGRAGAGGGFSHYTEFGANPIPVPGALWLMGAGLAGLGFANRKKKA